MKRLSRLHLTFDNRLRTIEFGIPEGKKELDEMFALRQSVYSSKRYLHDRFLKNKFDTDAYDRKNQCIYFIAKLEGQIVGTVRFIVSDPLPTENFFKFTPPGFMANLRNDQKVELSRLVIVKHAELGYLPRNIVLLYFIYTLVDYQREMGVVGGYAFLKKGIRTKLRRLRVPVHLVKKYEQRYPDDGMLQNYFNEKYDKVIPMYFRVTEISDYIKKIVNNRWMFKKHGEYEHELKNNMYNLFLRFFNVI